MAKLEILTGKRKGAVIDLSDGEFDVGNRKSAVISIRDPWISYNHAKIHGQAGRFFIEDLGSSNGTWIDGKKIERHELSGKTLIYFGKTKVRFEGAEAPAASPAGEKPWWDEVIDGGAAPQQDAGTRARLKRLEAELAEERGMRRALERYFDLPEGSRIGDAAKAGELEKTVEELQTKLRDAEKGGGAEVEAAVAKATEDLRQDHMTKIVELEAKVQQAEGRAVDFENRLKDKTENAKAELERVRESLEQELSEAREALEQARAQAAGDGDADEALSQERERAAGLEKELGEARGKLRDAEEQLSATKAELEEAQAVPAAGGEGGEEVETLKSQLWAAVEEATKWKEDARQARDTLEEAQAEADKAKAEHAQVVQEIDEISMEQIEIEEELNLKLDLLRSKLAEATGQAEDEIKSQLEQEVAAATAEEED